MRWGEGFGGYCRGIYSFIGFGDVVIRENRRFGSVCKRLINNIRISSVNYLAD